MGYTRHHGSIFPRSVSLAPLLMPLLLAWLPVSAQSSLCLPGSGTETGSYHDILPRDTVVAPWTNETPRELRSSERIDNLTSMRVDLAQWAPIAFDSNGQVSAADHDLIEFNLRSSIYNPPVNVISSSGVICPLADFAALTPDRWTRIQIPLASLGLTEQASIGRIKLKSAIAGPFTLWISNLRLVSGSGAGSGTGAPPDSLPLPDPDNPPQSDPPLSAANTFADWQRDPGVRGSIDEHRPSRVIKLEANGWDQLDDTAAFTAALEQTAQGGIIDVPAGTYYLSDYLRIVHDKQIIRGAGSDLTHLVFTESLPFGIAITGQYPQAPVNIIKGNFRSRLLWVANGAAIRAGQYALITDANTAHSQVISIDSVNARANATRLLLSHRLNSSFGNTASMQLFDANEFSGVEALSLDVKSDTTHIGDMIHMRSAAHVWIRDVLSKRARQAHVFTRQTYHCEIVGSTLLDATGHGDGKQGYGIDLANSTTGCLVENNTLGLLRHSILFNASANGNIVAFNHSYAPRHTNFAEGGPGDISLHSFAYANLIEGNVVERIHIGDAGAVGEGNLIYRNCTTSGPLTIDNSPDAVQHIVGNAIYGSNAQLHSTFMPPVLPEAPVPRPYLQPGNLIFDDDGVTLGVNAALPSLINNWHQGERWNAAPYPKRSYYQSTFAPLLQGAISGDWRADCQIPAVERAAGVQF